MVEFNDRRVDQPDFAPDGRGKFTLTTHGYAEEDAWAGQPVERRGKKEVHDYFRGQKDTATWKEANRLAARRAGRYQYSDLNDYAHEYTNHLVRVMATKGPDLARQFGEIKPGR